MFMFRRSNVDHHYCRAFHAVGYEENMTLHTLKYYEDVSKRSVICVITMFIDMVSCCIIH